MAILKCKMCGGDLNVSGDEKIVECEFCGTTQTVPNGNDEKKTNLFNRANRLRTDNEFDKAAGIYESIIAEFPEEAEGYWGLVLCNYGIEYVDDAKTGKKIPTCHRTLSYSVMDDDNFMQACENADVVARGVYREEAKAIDKLQKQIIAIVESEEPYDAFICYKETDDITKSRTEDSRLAQDIYTELIKEGYNVFFSRVTLREKAGTEYEPYIYAALKSAKIMLAIGTKYDYYDAVWVKNEWSRYISMMSDDSSKHLIPCYKNFDAYDIPKEFKNIQALDMGEVTFFKNLIDNVERFIPKAKQTETKIEQVVSSPAGGTTDALLKRAFMFLEDGDFESADEYCEKVLDIDPECAEAYLGKLMVELKVRMEGSLGYGTEVFDSSMNYQKAIRFADEGLKKRLNGYLDHRHKTLDLITKEIEKEDEEIKQQLQPFMNRAKILKGMIAVHDDNIIGLKTDGTVVAVGDNNFGQCNVSDWKDIVEISAGVLHTVGLKSDGTVVAVGDNDKGECNVSNWKNIVAVFAGSGHTVGLKSDGTVVSTGKPQYGKCDVSDWTDIVHIFPYRLLTAGIKKDGTIVANGNDEYTKIISQNRNMLTDLVDVRMNYHHLVGIKKDRAFIVASRYAVKTPSILDVVDVAFNLDFLALTAKGTVKAYDCRKYISASSISGWKDIISISAGKEHFIGLKSDGTVVAAGSNKRGQCNVSDWKDIVAISTGSYCTAGIKEDGTVVVTSSKEDGRCNVYDWKLFDDANNLEEERKIKMEAKRKEEEQRRLEEKGQQEKELKEQQEKQRIMADYRNLYLCQHCGGAFKGLFTKTCTKCGKKKDY